MNPVMKVSTLGKKFRRYPSSRPESVMEAAMLAWRHSRAENNFWAFRNVSFDVFPGEMLGIIGRNGAGKSTLLSIMAGLLKAEEGHVELRGRVSALLDLGRSLHPLLSGRENIRTSGLLNGLTRKQVDQQTNAIVDFAEIEEFLDAPVRTYSSGMKARLAFSVAIHTQPDILLIDEFLFVGDQFFQAKCLERIDILLKSGTTVLLSSHIAAKISSHCDRALWLGEHGVLGLGPANEVLEQYQAGNSTTSGSGPHPDQGS